MPRQLPWLDSSNSNSRTPAKKKARLASTNIPPDANDDFFDGTVLAKSDKGKKRADRVNEPDDVFPHRKPRTRRNSSSESEGEDRRLPSSSPPAIQDHMQPRLEYMRKGSRYNLRDDEWMMVEDEFLETAKLFTRHLHIAEYEKLKEQIQAKKKEQVEAVRPTAKGATFSAEGKMKERAKVQEKKQRSAIRDVFAPQDSESDDTPTSRPDETKKAAVYDGVKGSKPSASKARPTKPNGSDSDDLYAPRNAASTSKRSGTPFVAPKPRATFVRPAIPDSAAKARVTTSRRSRATPFDMLDDYVPPANRTTIPASSTERASSTTRFGASPVRSTFDRSTDETSTPARNRPTTTHQDDDDDGWGASRRESSTLSKETADRLAKRRAEREKDKKEKKDVNRDDIPTFLC